MVFGEPCIHQVTKEILHPCIDDIPQYYSLAGLALVPCHFAGEETETSSDESL